jgi:SAM-dependent methyltransferase
MTGLVMRWLGDRVERGRMLEIGCGVGRTVLPFADAFEHVEAIDVAPRMVAFARARGLPSNVSVRATDGERLEPFGDASMDFVFSEHVFQHIASAGVIEGYLSETSPHIRRYRRDPGSVTTAARAARLSVEWERGAASHWHWLLLSRA